MFMIENLEPTEKENNLAIKIKATDFPFGIVIFSELDLKSVYTPFVLCE